MAEQDVGMTTDRKIATMEEQLARLQETVADLRSELGRSRMEQWRARIEDLEVQVHVATMDSRERLDLLIEMLRNQWDRTRAQLDDASATASTVAASWLTDLSELEHAYLDVRRALLDSRSTTSHWTGT